MLSGATLPPVREQHAFVLDQEGNYGFRKAGGNFKRAVHAICVTHWCEAGRKRIAVHPPLK